MSVFSLLIASVVFWSSIFENRLTQSGIYHKVASVVDSTGIKNSKKLQSSSRVVIVGYGDEYDKLPKLVFKSVSESEFNSVKSKVWFQKIKPKVTINFFYVQTNLKKHKFKINGNYGGTEQYSGVELHGFYPKLNLFALTEFSTAENLNFGSLMLLDKITDYAYEIVSFTDGGVELPQPSTNDKFLVYYDNDTYGHKSGNIGVLKVNHKSKPRTYLTPYTSFKSTEFAIEEIRWQSDHIFYVKGYEEVNRDGKWIKKFTYHRTSFK